MLLSDTTRKDQLKQLRTVRVSMGAIASSNNNLLVFCQACDYHLEEVFLFNSDIFLSLVSFKQYTFNYLILILILCVK